MTGKHGGKRPRKKSAWIRAPSTTEIDIEEGAEEEKNEHRSRMKQIAGYWPIMESGTRAVPDGVP